MVDPTHARLSIVRNAAWSRSRARRSTMRAWREPVALSADRLIDGFLEAPFYGSRQMTRWLRRQGDTVVSQTPPDATAAGCRSSSGPGRLSRTRRTGSIPTCCATADHAADHVWSFPCRLSGRGDGLGEPQGAVLASVQHARCASRPCTRRSSAMALRRSSTVTRAANSPASTSPTCSRRRAFASRGRQGPLDGQRVHRAAVAIAQVRVYLSTGSPASAGGWTSTTGVGPTRRSTTGPGRGVH